VGTVTIHQACSSNGIIENVETWTMMTHQACSSNGISKGLGVGGTTAHMEGHPHHLYVQLLGSG